MLLLDYNEDRSLQVSTIKEENAVSGNWTLNFGTAVESIQGSSAKVVINTLFPYTGFGGGIYKMTDVKRMTAKEDFLKMPLKDRNCEVELYEDCRTRKLLEKCNCVPWELSWSQVHTYSLIDQRNTSEETFPKRSEKRVIHMEETVSRRTPSRVSTATQLVLECMRMFSLSKKV